MLSTLNRQFPKSKSLWFSAAALTFVLIFGWVLRYQATMTTLYPSGINAAYYLVQARAILETGSLGLPDFPLLFYFHAGLAGVLSLFMSQADAIMAVVRWTDLLVPVLIAIPVFLFALSFPRSGKSKWAPVLATLMVGLIAVANSSLLRMSSDFQKNAAALPLSLTFVFFLYQSLSHHRRRDYILTTIFFVLTLLIHIGVAALTLAIAGLMAAISLITDPQRKRTLIVLAGLFLTVCLALTLVYFYDPTRIERLFGIIFDPTGLFSNTSDNKGPGNPQAPNGNFSLNSNLFLGNLLGMIGIVVAIVHHKTMRRAERTLLWAASLTALFFASPLISGQWSQRLALMAFLPGLIPLIYLVIRQKWGWAYAAPVLAIVLFTTLNSPNLANQRSITAEAYDELVAIGETLPEGENLVVAAHGLEWWVAWTMHTDISNRLQLAIESWDEYDNIYTIAQIDPDANPSLGGAQRGNPPAGGNRPFSGGTPQGGPRQQGPQQQGFTRPSTQNFQGPAGNPDAINSSNAATSLVYEGQYYNLTLLESKPAIGQNQQGPQPGNPSVSSEGENSQGILPQGQPQAQFQGQLPSSIPLTDTLAMVPRPAWGATQLNIEARAEQGRFHPQDNPNGILRYSEPLAEWLNTIVVHHSALALSQGVLEIQQLHMGKRGYADIGYHFVIDAEGVLYEGRRINIRGAHVQGFNTGTVGIVLLGNMNIIEPSPQQLATLEALTAYLRDTYGINHLAGHKDFNPELTEGPGVNLYPLLPSIAANQNLVFGTQGYVSPPWEDKG